MEQAQPKNSVLRGDQQPLESKLFEAVASLGDQDFTVSDDSSAEQAYENQPRPRVMKPFHKSLYPDLEFPSYLTTSDIIIPTKNTDPLRTEDKQTSSTT